MKLLHSASLALLVILLAASYLEAVPITAPAPYGSDTCGNLCQARCAKAGVYTRCLKYCGICCEKCNCVPSGTYGNKDECPCYRDMRTNKNKPKCP